MPRIRIEDLPAQDEHLTPEELEQIEGAGRPSFRPMLEGLENRELLAATLTAAVNAGVLKVEGTAGNDNVAIRRTADNKQIEVLDVATQKAVGRFDAGQVKALDVLMGGGNDRLDLTGLGKLGRDAHLEGGKGALDVLYNNQAGRQTQDHWRDDRLTSRDTTTADGAKVHGEWQGDRWVVTTTGSKDFERRVEVFEKEGGKLLSRKTSGVPHAFQGFSYRKYVEEVWGQDGSYTKNVWKKEAHGGEGSDDHVSKTVIRGSEMTVTGYHLKGYTVYNGALASPSTNATVTWKYALKSDFSIERLKYYRAVDGGWSATWSPDEYPNKAGYSREFGKFGWLEWYPQTYGGVAVPPPLSITDGLGWKGWDSNTFSSRETWGTRMDSTYNWNLHRKTEAGDEVVLGDVGAYRDNPLARFERETVDGYLAGK